MVARKRGRQEIEEASPPTTAKRSSRAVAAASKKAAAEPEEPSTLDRIRNMWEFANLMQYIYIFGKAVKIDEDLTIEDLETECLIPSPSRKLAEIGLALLKFVSSHRGLTHDLFDEYTRRQYLAKAPNRNPFGDEETPKRFDDFDAFTKIRVLYQLSQWTLIPCERMRERMPEVKDSEQTQWRVEEIGYDSHERLYFVLDDNRLYRRTDPPLPSPPPPKPKANTKKAKAAARASKRRKLAVGAEAEDDEEIGAVNGDSGATDDGFGGMKWECLAVTGDDYRTFLESIRRSKDADEKFLHQRIVEEVMPVIEKAEEEQQRKAARKEKELLTLQKLAGAKRSSRIASRLDKQKEEQEVREAEAKRQAELVQAKKDEERRTKMEAEREARMMTREKRLLEREYRRRLHEEELANLSQGSENVEPGQGRKSERHLQAEKERHEKELEKIAQEDEWFFDCSGCGVHGDNVDDGTHSVACEKCNVWQHSACLGVSREEAEREDFHFICKDCQRRIEDAKKPKIPSLKFRVGPSSSPPAAHHISSSFDEDVAMADIENQAPAASPSKSTSHHHHHHHPPPSSHHLTHPGPRLHILPPHPPVFGQARQSTNVGSSPLGVLNGPRLSPQGQTQGPLFGAHQNGHAALGAGSHQNGFAREHAQESALGSFGLSFGPSGHANSRPGSSSGVIEERGHHIAAHGIPNGVAASPSKSANGNSIWRSSPITGSGGGGAHHGAFTASPNNSFFDSFDRQRRPSLSSQGQPQSPVPSPVKSRSSPPAPNKDVGKLEFPEPGSPSLPPLAPSTTRPVAISPVKRSSSPVQQPLPRAPSHPPQQALLSSPISAPSAIPPASSGISPTKHSPPRRPSQSRVGLPSGVGSGSLGEGANGSKTRTPVVVPPVASLSPSPPPQQIMTPPHKSLPPMQEQSKGDVNNPGL
ncbi:hypothetical protein L228DRAFT_11053 [Xylona heveae TC161]|uniref:Zinc finger PHD-type domain-containing protein n=1 Tax=Xylona heveae (strain CBS 132557 / TC161) TaxID=1328760 RepID=A0A165JL08_XYLHT|nr:hypothetical protein L228DRAFT_11053 [Xylona heveae TC161]KZF26370.1 hypothetical protein L228DRAFT_11053 [Xylona heveae TC161]